MNNFLNNVKERKIRKWLSIYISSAITAIGIIHLLSIRYQLPDFIFDFVFFTLLFGIGIVITIAWFHGKEGRQKIKKSEIVIYTIFILCWVIVITTSIKFDTTSKGIGDSKTIAVLPFNNFNETKESEFFADGITDDVLTQLSKISDLKVISRTSVMKYKNTEMNISDISKELGAGTILEGSVRTIGNKIRIVGQLIDANNDVHIWSETYDREMEDVFEIQTDIAERIAAALHAKLLPLEKELIERKSTENLDAYTFFLKGKHHYYNYTEEENEKAIDFYKKALVVDSNYALALAGLSEAYGQKVSKYWQSDEWLDSALVLSKKALEIDSDLAEAYKALASYYQAKDEYQLALTNYQKAIELNPNYWSAILNYGQVKTFLGNHDEALYWTRRANDLTPNDIFGIISLGMVYKNLNCDSSAIKWSKKALELEPEHKFATYYLGELYLGIGDFKNANKYFERVIEIDSNWVFAWFLGGRIEAAQSNNEKAKEYYDKYMTITDTSPEWFYAHELIQLGESDSAKSILEEEVKDYTEYLEETDHTQVFNYMALAEIYSLLNDKENSFKLWKTAVDKGYTDINRIKYFSYLANIKQDKRYDKMLNLMQSKIDSIKFEVENQYPDYAECE